MTTTGLSDWFAPDVAENLREELDSLIDGESKQYFERVHADTVAEDAATPDSVMDVDVAVADDVVAAAGPAVDTGTAPEMHAVDTPPVSPSELLPPPWHDHARAVLSTREVDVARAVQPAAVPALSDDEVAIVEPDPAASPSPVRRRRPARPTGRSVPVVIHSTDTSDASTSDGETA